MSDNRKNYNVKVYSLAGVYLRTLAPSVVMSGVSFTSQINGGQGEARMQLALPFNTTLIAYNNIIKVFETDDNNQTARQIYTGIVGSLRRSNDKGAEYIEVRAIGLGSMLSWDYYDAAGSYSFSKSLDSSAILMDIVDRFSVKYPGLVSYTNGVTVETSGAVANITFLYDKHLAAINKAAVNTEYFWTIDGSGRLQYHPRLGGIGVIQHNFDMWADVDTIDVEENVENLVNKYILDYTGGTVTAADAASQAAYWIRELYETKTEITNATTANAAATAYVNKNKDPKRKVTILLNNNYFALLYSYWYDTYLWADGRTWTETAGQATIESISPGDLVTIRNFEYTISLLQIAKIEYNPDNIRIELEDIKNLAEEIFT